MSHQRRRCRWTCCAATNFTPAPLQGILGDLYDDLVVEDGQPALHIQGNTEHTHGLTSSLLSNIAIRSGEILRAMLQVDDDLDRPGELLGISLPNAASA